MWSRSSSLRDSYPRPVALVRSEQLQLLAPAPSALTVESAPSISSSSNESSLPEPAPGALSAAEIHAACDKAKQIHAQRWFSARLAAESDAKRRRSWRAEHLLVSRRLFRQSGGLLDLTAVVDSKAREAMRFLPDVPISDDDLKVQIEHHARPGGALAEVPASKRAATFIATLLDASCDPLYRNLGALSRAQENELVRRLAGNMLSRQIETHSRNYLSNTQEASVREVVADGGFSKREDTIPLGEIDDLGVGKFTPREVKIAGPAGNSKADCAVRTSTDSIAVIEAKVSGSQVNGHKRLVKEVVNKGAVWREALGEDVTYPVAVLGGVFKPEDVITAQEHGIFIVWDHDLGRLAELLRTLRGEPVR